MLFILFSVVMSYQFHCGNDTLEIFFRHPSSALAASVPHMAKQTPKKYLLFG